MSWWILVLCLANAEPIEQHQAEMRQILKKTETFEKRIDELKEKKKKLTEGDEMEEVLSEMTDIHKELLRLRKARQTLRTHALTEHPHEDLATDLSFYKQETSPKQKDAKADEALDKKLDALLLKVQTQYARTLGGGIAVSGKLKENESKVQDKLDLQKQETQREDKSKYIKEHLKTTIKAQPGSPPEPKHEKEEAHPEPASGGHH